MTIEEYEEVKNLLLKIVESSPKFRRKVYLVGGCLRQSISGEKEVNDIDIYVDFIEGATEFIEYLKETVPVATDFGYYKRSHTHKFSLGGLSFGYTKIEVSQPKEHYLPRVLETGGDESYIISDANDRDFTINAIYQQISPWWKLWSPNCGGSDLSSKKLSLCSQKAFINDPLRMLRAIRFMHEGDFEMTDLCGQLIQKQCHLLDQIPKERVMIEFVKILSLPKFKDTFASLITSGLMRSIFPELSENFDYDQMNKHHHLSLGGHTYKVFLNLPAECSLELKLAALLHDISKPYEYQEKEDGQRTYHGHEKTSAKMAGDVLRRLTFSEITIKKVQILIENHMRLKQHYNYKSQEYTGSPKYTRKIIRELGDDLEDLLYLIEADNMAHKDEWNMPGQVKSFREQMKNLPELKGKRLMKSPVSGKDVKEFFGIDTGPEVGKILDLIQDIWDEEPSDDKNILLKKAYERYQKD